MKKMFRRLGAMVMVLAMMLSMAAMAGAVNADGTGSYSVVVYKEGTTTASMASDAFGDTATITKSGDTYTVSIPIQVITQIYGDSVYTGTISDLTVAGNSADVSYDNGVATFNLSSVSNTMELAATMTVTVTPISGEGGYVHDDVAATIVLTAK